MTFPPMFRDDDDDPSTSWPRSVMDPAAAEDVTTFTDSLAVKRAEVRERHLASTVEWLTNPADPKSPRIADNIGALVARVGLQIAEQRERLAAYAYFLTDDDHRDRLHFIETTPQVDRFPDVRRNVERWTWTQDAYPACWIVRPT